MFGTYRHPAPGHFPQLTGVRNATDGNTFYEAIAFPFVEWGRGLRRLVMRERGVPAAE